MDNKIKSIIDHSIDLTLGCLDLYKNWLDISKAVGIDELSHRSDKERYLLSVLFAFGLAKPIIENLPSDEFSPALEKIINDLHSGINKNKKLKDKLFKSMRLNALDTLETCVWLSQQQTDKTMHIILITTAHLNHLAVSKEPTVIENDQNKKLIENGSKLKIGEPIFNGLTNIYKDNEIRISNFKQSIGDF